MGKTKRMRRESCLYHCESLILEYLKIHCRSKQNGVLKKQGFWSQKNLDTNPDPVHVTLGNLLNLNVFIYKIKIPIHMYQEGV